MKPNSVLRGSLVIFAAFALACGGNKSSQTQAKSAEPPAHKCGDHAKVETFDLHDDKADKLYAPCSTGGHQDYSGLIHFEAVDHGVKIIIEAKDDEVQLLGPNVKERDAVIVYPTGPNGEKKEVEVPLAHHPGGYRGEKIIHWNELAKLTDEGSRIDIAIHDHDNKSGTHEELKVSVAVSTGKSCEKAIDENPQEITMGKNSGPDLTKEQLGRPMQTDAFMRHCGLSDSANAKICAAVKKGKPLGVSVEVTPSNNKVAACIDRAVRKLSFPSSEKLDVVKQAF
jgi:hypothetical protein